MSKLPAIWCKLLDRRSLLPIDCNRNKTNNEEKKKKKLMQMSANHKKNEIRSALWFGYGHCVKCWFLLRSRNNENRLSQIIICVHDITTMLFGCFDYHKSYSDSVWLLCTTLYKTRKNTTTTTCAMFRCAQHKFNEQSFKNTEFRTNDSIQIHWVKIETSMFD